MRLFGVDIESTTSSAKIAVPYASNPTKEDDNKEKNMKGKHWTLVEHKRFLEGLKELGKGNWCGIAKRYVLTRNATQVASHAQKYFQRREKVPLRNGRPSMFDTNLYKMDQVLPKTLEGDVRSVHRPGVQETSPNSSATPAATAGNEPIVAGPETWETKDLACPTNGRGMEEAPNLLRSVSSASCDSEPSSEVRGLQLTGEGGEPSPPPSTSHVDRAGTSSALQIGDPDSTRGDI